MLHPDELDAIQTLNEMFEKEEKFDKQSPTSSSSLQKLNKTHNHHHHHQHQHHQRNHSSSSSVFRCSETRTFKRLNDQINNNKSNNNNNNNDSTLIPTGLPRIKTKITVKILERDCCITVMLDPTVLLNTVCAMYDLNEQIIIIGYQRLITLKTLDNLPLKFNAIIEQNDNFTYDLTTYVEHKYKICLDKYYLNSARVKQKQDVVYIMIPRKFKTDNTVC
ncbi:hypothetical protein EWB00_003518 [Schistosoma japonicum]|uniref:Uncharacterized protein n=1 Tax=Schistosoma japonicum TaxID=6182 RepID=A0A4Z2D874_SCHJA|nr:hypothetical protein EWB00_003518 [Schistosoma japonicum]TNN12698.1 hypothetical protein EWB00_003518 [Schistosoma japonicum]